MNSSYHKTGIESRAVLVGKLLQAAESQADHPHTLDTIFALSHFHPLGRYRKNRDF
jgi:hypothetical protein